MNNQAFEETLWYEVEVANLYKDKTWGTSFVQVAFLSTDAEALRFDSPKAYAETLGRERVIENLGKEYSEVLYIVPIYTGRLSNS